MLNKIILLLSMTLNLVLALVVFGHNNKSLRALDLRDAVSDNPTSSQLMTNSLANITPVQVTPVVATPAPIALATAQAAAPVTEVAPVVAAAPVKSAALLIKGGNDWAAYKQDAVDDSDVVISNIFRSRKRGEKAVAAAVRRNKARGKDILFSCVLPEKSGGVFYVIRMAPASIPASQIALLPGMKSAQVSSNDINIITKKDETNIQETF